MAGDQSASGSGGALTLIHDAIAPSATISASEFYQVRRTCTADSRLNGI